MSQQEGHQQQAQKPHTDGGKKSQQVQSMTKKRAPSFGISRMGLENACSRLELPNIVQMVVFFQLSRAR